ncbi:MAG: hypothetical protein ACXIVD_01150 [Salinarimonas sp.]
MVNSSFSETEIREIISDTKRALRQSKRPFTEEASQDEFISHLRFLLCQNNKKPISPEQFNKLKHHCNEILFVLSNIDEEIKFQIDMSIKYSEYENKKINAPKSRLALSGYSEEEMRETHHIDSIKTFAQGLNRYERTWYSPEVSRRSPIPNPMKQFIESAALFWDIAFEKKASGSRNGAFWRVISPICQRLFNRSDISQDALERILGSDRLNRKNRPRTG